MKHVVICLLFVVISNCALCQNQRTKNSFPTYQGIITQSGLSDREIYSNLKVWATHYFRSVKDVTQLDDYENKKIIIKALGRFDYYLKTPKVGFTKSMEVLIQGKCFYTLTLQSRNNRFRYTIDITEVEVGNSGQSAFNEILNNPNGDQSRVIIKNVKSIVNSIIESLEQSDSLIDEDDNW